MADAAEVMLMVLPHQVLVCMSLMEECERAVTPPPTSADLLAGRHTLSGHCDA